MRFWFLGFVFLLLDACVDPINVVTTQLPPQLVVDGVITNQPGPYTVRLFHSSKVDTLLENYLPVSHAKVIISDNAGNSEELTEKESGVYLTQPNGIQGTVGREYTLQITTNEGQVYESTPDKMLPPGTIDNVYKEYYVKDVPDRSEKPWDGFNIFLDVHGEKTQETTYFRWAWEGNYKLLAYPEERYYIDPNDRKILDPVPCSGYVAVNNRLVRVGDCTCCVCWLDEYQKDLVVNESVLAASNTFNRVKVRSLDIISERFYEKYYMKVKLMSLSKTAFTFWNAILLQKQGATSVFQPPTGKVRGNIFAADGKETVSGIFYASAIDERTFFIEREDLPRKIDNYDHALYRKSCLDLDNSTTEKPSFWK